MDYGLTGNHAIIPANTVTQTARAFTGHEQIKEISGLIHSERLTNDNNLSFLVSNARVYDSDIGRFLSADTLIQDPHDSQSYNRYSYARNNPLVFTDPSGHSWFSKLWKKIKVIVSIVVAAVIAIYLPQLLLAHNLFAANAVIVGGLIQAPTLSAMGMMVVGAAAGFASGAIMTGSLKGALTGALWGGIGAGLAFGIAHMIGLGGAGNLFQKGVNAGKLFIKSALHGLSRGIISMAQGGTFKSGFASGFSSSFFSPGTKVGGTGAGGFGLRTSIAAIVGGTASKLGGGKFSNGAVSGAFVHMFNAERITLKSFLEVLSSTPADMVISSTASENMNKAGLSKSASNIFGDMISGGVTGAAGGYLVANISGAVVGGVFGIGAGYVTGAPMEAFGVNNYMDGFQNTLVQNVQTYNYESSFETIVSTYTRY